jgi:hypothetical protein
LIDALSRLAQASGAAVENHGCQMVYFQTKNPTLGKFGLHILWPFGKFFGYYGHLVYF